MTLTRTDALIRHVILRAVALQREPTEAHLVDALAQRGVARADVERVLLTMLDAGEVRSTVVPFRGLAGEPVRHAAAVAAGALPSEAPRVLVYRATVRAKDGAPAQTWCSEVWFNGREWRVRLEVNGHEHAPDIAIDEVRESVGYRAPLRARARLTRVLTGRGKVPTESPRDRLIELARRAGLSRPAFTYEFASVPASGPEPGAPSGAPAGLRLIVRGADGRIARVFEVTE